MLLSSVVSGAALKIGDLVTGRSSECVGMGVGVSVPTEETDDPQKVCLDCASLHAPPPHTHTHMDTHTHTDTHTDTWTHTHAHTHMDTRTHGHTHTHTHTHTRTHGHTRTRTHTHHVLTCCYMCYSSSQCRMC